MSLSEYIETEERIATEELQEKGILTQESGDWVLWYLADRVERDPDWPLGATFEDYSAYMDEHYPHLSQEVRDALCYYAAKNAIPAGTTI